MWDLQLEPHGPMDGNLEQLAPHRDRAVGWHYLMNLGNLLRGNGFVPEVLSGR